ncbi:MAG TPA: YkgJ family cysteine cluster protein [Bryobacteraceae bacterium]|nr:YkgJ family cysteine cluster protein [Bryobacteraceae bacterium]
MLTDLVQIRLLGEKKRDENLRFRRFMKSRDHSDRILRRIGEQIQEQIDCTQCASCCKVATTSVSDRDVERLARHLGISREKFVAEYTMHDAGEPLHGGRILRRTKEGGCVFLEGNLCSLYEARPETCQRFPHVVRGNGSIASRMWQFVDRACYCPIVYHSLEAFKQELGFRR